MNNVDCEEADEEDGDIEVLSSSDDENGLDAALPDLADDGGDGGGGDDGGDDDANGRGKARIALCSLPGFDSEIHVGYDVMHTVGGVVKDLLKLLRSTRVTAKVLEFERTVNKRFLDDKFPWEASSKDLDEMSSLLGYVVEASPSRVAGSRFRRLLSNNKKHKSHSLLVFASSLGLYALKALQGSLGKPQLEAIVKVMKVCSALQAKSWTRQGVDDLRFLVVEAICYVEAYLPTRTGP